MKIKDILIKLLGLFKNKVTTTTTSTVTKSFDPNYKLKVALCMGLNDYPGTNNDLRGCVNDANDFANLLKSQYGFQKIEVLLDQQVTFSNFKNKINEFISLNPDVLVITNSSHGTSVIDNSGDEFDGKDEALCMYDRIVIDDELREILDWIPYTTSTYFISDSCHSGGISRQLISALNNEENKNDHIKIKYMPPEDIMDSYSLMSTPIKSKIFKPKTYRKEITYSGCAANEFSYDASFNGRPNGAFTFNMIKILRSNPNLTNEQFFYEIKKFLPTSRYPQTPQMETEADEMKNKIIFS